MSLDELIRSRRTVHQFESRPVPEPLVLEALESARWAPNHKLTEPWRFHLLGKETAAAISERNAEMLRATKGESAAAHKLARWRSFPGWMVLTQVLTEDPLRRQEDYAACCCAAQNFMLSLWDKGVASKWSTGPVTRDNEFYSLLGIDPSEQQVVGLFWFGYPSGEQTCGRSELESRVRRLP